MFGRANAFAAAQNFNAAGAVQLPPPRILVVDDDNLHRMIVYRLATKAGYLPAGAASYDEAVALVQESAFDLITLDLLLGNHGGNEMLHHLAILDCRAPIILISGCDHAICKDAIALAGRLNLYIWECFAKPVDLAMLRHFLERLTEMRTVAASAA